MYLFEQQSFSDSRESMIALRIFYTIDVVSWSSGVFFLVFRASKKFLFLSGPAFTHPPHIGGTTSGETFFFAASITYVKNTT